MDTVFINLENSKTSENHVLVLKLTDKLGLRSCRKSNALSNLSISYTWKNIKSSYLFQRGVVTLNYQMDHIQYQIFKTILTIFLRNM